MRVLRRVTAGLAMLFVVGSCDGDGGDEAVPTSTATATMATTTTTTAPATSTTLEKELTAASRVRLDGIGPIRVFMTLAEASAAVGRTVGVDPSSLIEEEDEALCGFAGLAGGPDGLSFMVNRDAPADDWLIVRVDITEPSRIATGGGIRIGATEDEVKKVYGERLRVEPHEYTGPVGHYLTLDVDGPGGMMLLFETDGTKVLRYRSGDEGAVRAPEGCA